MTLNPWREIRKLRAERSSLLLERKRLRAELHLALDERDEAVRRLEAAAGAKVQVAPGPSSGVTWVTPLHRKPRS